MAKVTSIGGGEVPEVNPWDKFTKFKDVDPTMVVAYSEAEGGYVLMVNDEHPLEVIGLLEKIKHQYLIELMYAEEVGDD